MALQEKYASVLELGQEFGIKDGYVNEENGVLKVGGLANTQFEKDTMWNAIKVAGGETPTDIEADIKVECTDCYHKHIVAGGETLGGISKKYYGKSSAYNTIFKANTDILKNPDVIHPGQELTIPFA